MDKNTIDKNTLKLIIYVLIVVITIFLLYSIWKFDISNNSDRNIDRNDNNKLEEFEVSDDELNKMQSSQKYNLLTAPISMLLEEYTKEIPLVNNKDKFIKQIYIISEDDTVSTSNTIKKREIPLDLEISVIDSKGNERAVNMQKYKFKSPAPNQLSYADSSVNFMDLIDMNGELLYGNKIKLKSDTYKFMFDGIYIFGNDTGKDYKIPGGERDITINISGIDTGNLSANKPYLINRIVFKKPESFNNAIARRKATASKNKESTISIGETSMEIKTDNFINVNIDSKTEGFTNTGSNNQIILTPEILTHYYENPMLVMDKLTSININIPSDYLIDKIHGKEASTADIQQFKYVNNMIDFRDSLNPDTAVGDASLAGKNTLSMDILDVLNYQLKINTELKELDLNKFNIRELYNQKLDIASTIAKIDRVSNKYLDLIKDGDTHNAKKFIETIQILQNIKGELEEQEKLQKVDFNLNIKL